MAARIWFLLSLAGAVTVSALQTTPTPACCPVPPSGKPVVNADQTVILIWDAANKTEHFIRQASFKSAADDFGFLVPTPTQPELEESGNEAFPFLLKLTEPEHIKTAAPRGVDCTCSKSTMGGLSKGEAQPAVLVLQEKLVAGLHAVVLETKNANDLVKWLKDHEYAFSPAVEAWAKPYVEKGWKMTALKVAKKKDETKHKSVAAAALRLTFKADRPLFPYREPDPEGPAKALGAKKRLLRIYFVSDARYQGDLTREVPWTGKVAWANQLQPEDRKKALELLKLPETTGPAQWWLTEFEDDWAYRAAPADVYFARASDQDTVKRPPIIEYVSAPWPTDATVYALAAVVVLPPLLRRVRRRRNT
jgi:hypothetical protein